ncbi:MAG: hypothetical protein NVS1B11_25670 [Terriglobales bacterium]
MKKKITLLCVDDDPGIRSFYLRMFSSHGYEVITCENGRQALKLFRSSALEIDAVISDYDMPEMNGAELAAELKRSNPMLPIIMASGSQPVLEEAMNFADASIEKGSSMRVFLERLERLLSRRPLLAAV